MTMLNLCPVCHQGYLTPQVDTNTIVIYEKSYDLPCHFAVCNFCESEIADADDTNQNAQHMRNLLDELGADLRDVLASKEQQQEAENDEQ